MAIIISWRDPKYDSQYEYFASFHWKVSLFGSSIEKPRDYSFLLGLFSQIATFMKCKDLVISRQPPSGLVQPLTSVVASSG
jgi:hypothetical protein